MLKRWHFLAVVVLSLTTTFGCAGPSNFSFLQDEHSPAERRLDIPVGVHGLVQMGNGDILLSDSFGNGGSSHGRVLYRWAAPHTGTLEELELSGSIPAGMEWIDEELFVCDAGVGYVSVLNSDLEFVRAYEVPAPWNVTKLSTGELIAVSAHGAVYQLQDDGGAEELFAGLDAPFDVVAAADGTFWLSEQGEADGVVTRRTLDGTVVESLPVMDNPEGLLVDTANALWIADTGADKIFRKPSGETTVDLITDGIEIPIVGIQTQAGDILFNGTKDGVGGLFQVGSSGS